MGPAQAHRTTFQYHPSNMSSACSTPSPHEALIVDSHAQPVRLFRNRYHHRLQRSRSPSIRLPQANASTNDSSRPSIRSNIPWSEEGMGCWSDAATASTVLSLLHKEPLMPPPPPTRSSSSESIQTASKRNRLTCSVCFGHLDDGCFPDSPIAAACDHSGIPESHICVACLRRSLGVQVTSSSTCAVTCPLCCAQLSDEEVHHWASPQTFRAYDRMRTWQVLEENAEFVTCIRPDCGYGQLHADGLEDPIVVCGSCGTRTCFIHRNTAWHEGLTCAEYEETSRARVPDVPRRSVRRREILEEAPRVPGLRRGWVNTTQEEYLSMQMIAEIAKPCPYCNAATEKIGGCKQITCM